MELNEIPRPNLIGCVECGAAQFHQCGRGLAENLTKQSIFDSKTSIDNEKGEKTCIATCYACRMKFNLIQSEMILFKEEPSTAKSQLREIPDETGKTPEPEHTFDF